MPYVQQVAGLEDALGAVTMRLLSFALLLVCAAAHADAPTVAPCPRDRDVTESLEGLARAAQAPLPFAELRLEGTGASITELNRAFAGVSLSANQAAVVVRRLRRSGVYKSIELAVAPPTATAGSALVLSALEFPTVTDVQLTGLEEHRSDELLERLLLREGRRWRWRLETGDDDATTSDDVRVTGPRWLTRLLKVRHARDGVACDDADDEDEDDDRETGPELAVRELTLRIDDERLVPGVVQGGVEALLRRLVSELRHDGYLLATAQATLSPQGVLEIEVDEGHLGAIRTEGLTSPLDREVLDELGLHEGAVVLRDQLTEAFARVERRFPFLDGDSDELGAPSYEVEATSTEQGTRYTSRPTPATPSGKRRFAHPSPHPHLDGKTLVVAFDTSNPWDFWFDARELVRHTQVTSFSPGLHGAATWWSPTGWGAVRVEGAINFSFGQPRVFGGATALLNVKLPRLYISELGGRLSLESVDTEDGWRVSNLDSYLNSMFFNRSGRDYFKRSGGAAFLTMQPWSKLAVGAEYRLDRYESLGTPGHFFSFFNNDGAPANQPVQEGRFGSVLLRVELNSQKLGPNEAIARDATTHRFVPQTESASFVIGTVNTLELSGPQLGGDAGTSFWRLISDTTATVPLSPQQRLRLRLRGATGANLPPQKQEALGGWGSLRGYDFKEFAGDSSVLVSAEYRVWHFLSGFADVGWVRQGGPWTGTKLGLGVGVSIPGDWLSLQAAWRTDEKAKAAPEVRLVIDLASLGLW